MSQSIRTPRAIAIRAVAAASLFTSKSKIAKDDKSDAAKEKAEAENLARRAGQTPQAKR